MYRKILAAGVLLVVASSLVKATKKERVSLRTVPRIDLSRYSGLWYEVARLPNRFENKCVGEVTARYTLLNDKRIEVVNQCRTKNGGFNKAQGVARLADKDGPNSRLKVRFAPSFLSFLPFVWGDYQVIELADDYSHALVGEPGRKYLWILSRTPKIDEGVYKRLTDLAAAQGFDVSKLIKTRQD